MKHIIPYDILLEAKGDCYQAGGRLIMNFFGDKDHKLVHGMVSGQGALEGNRFGHCWVESKDTVLDHSNDKKLEIPKDVYYLMGRIDPAECHYYTPKEAAKKMSTVEHWGPWDMTGLTVKDTYGDLGPDEYKELVLGEASEEDVIPDDKKEIGKRKLKIKNKDMKNIKKFEDFGEEKAPKGKKVKLFENFKEDRLNEEGWHDVKHNYNYDPESLTTIEGTPLKNGMGIKQLIKLWKKDEKLEKKIGGAPDGSLVNYYSQKSYELAVHLHKKYGLDFTVDFYRTAWNYGGHINPSYHLKGPWESRKAPIRINTGRAGSSGGCQFGGVLDGLDIRESGYRGDKLESGTHYSWSIYPVKEMDEFFEIISSSFQSAFSLPMTSRNMVSLGKSYAKLHKAWMKIWGTGGKLDKAYDKFTALRPRKNFDITYSSPELFPKYVKWYIDLPRSFRHPDEYGGQDNWSDEKWEMDGAQEEVSSIISNFCRKHGIDDWISADR